MGNVAENVENFHLAAPLIMLKTSTWASYLPSLSASLTDYNFLFLHKLCQISKIVNS